MGSDSLRADERSISPELGAALFVGLVLILALGVASLSFGLTDRLNDDLVRQDADDCPGFQEAEFKRGGEDFTPLLEELKTNNCALWFDAGDFQTSNGKVVEWRDRGPNDFDAVPPEQSDRPSVVYDSDVGSDVLEFEADHSQLDDADGRPDPGTTDGDYLNIDRDIGDLGVSEGSGFVIVATVKPDEFDRNGVWTVGKAGVDGREFSMRTCSSYSFDGCQTSDPEGEWRAQHWGAADIDFSSGDDSAGEWLVLTHAYDGEDAYIRINGEEVARDDVDLNLSQNRDIQLGRWERTDDDPNYWFDGRLAEIAVFDRELTDNEVEDVEEYMSAEHNIALNGPID
jgi:hypothetical protein